MIEVNITVGFPAGADYERDVLGYGEKLAKIVEEKYLSARLGDAGTAFGEGGEYERDLHFEVESVQDGCDLLGTLTTRLLDDGFTVLPERRDGLVRDENTMDEDRLTVQMEIEPGVARVGLIAFVDASAAA